MADFKTTWFLKLKERVLGPLDKIISKAGGAEKAIAKIKLQQQKLADMAGGLQSKLTKLTVGAAAFAALSYGSLQFESAMAMTNTMAQKQGVEFEKLTDKVRGLSEEIPLAKDALANGLYNVISAGVPEKNWIQFLEDSSKAAVGGGAELGVVIDATAGIIKNYNLAWDEAIAVQDKFQKTVELGQIPGLEALATALPRVAGAANHLKVSQEELMSSFATFTGVTGPTTNEVATQMQALFNSLMKPSAEAKKIAGEMGIVWNSTAIEAAGGMRKFAQSVVPEIEAYAAKMGITQDEVIGALTGSAEALKPLAALISETGDVFEANATKLANSAGSVEKAFSFVDETKNAQLIKFKNSFGNLVDKVVEGLEPLFAIGAALTETVLGVAKWIYNLSPGLSKLVTTVAGAIFVWKLWTTAIAFAKVKMAMLKNEMLLHGIVTGKTTLGMWLHTAATTAWTAVTTAATTAFGALNAVISANPIGAIIVAVIALTAVVTAAIRKYDEWGAALLLFLGPLGAVINIIQSFRRNWDMVVEAFRTDGILSGLWAIGKVLVDALLMPIQQLMEVIHEVTGFDWAGKAADGLRSFREDMGVSVESKSVKEDPNNGWSVFVDKDYNGAPGVEVKPGEKLTASKYADNDKPIKPTTDGPGKTSGISATGSGDGGSRTVHQNNEVHMHFTLPENWRNQLDDIKAEMLSVFGKAASDAAIAATK